MRNVIVFGMVLALGLVLVKRAKNMTESTAEIKTPGVEKTPGRKKKSNFYQVRWHKVGISETVAAEVIGVTVEQILQWDKEGAPVYVERLLLLWDRKNVGVPGWDGWLFSRGSLIYKRQRWRPELLLNQRDKDELISSLESEVRRLKTPAGMIAVLKNRLPAIRGSR